MRSANVAQVSSSLPDVDRWLPPILPAGDPPFLQGLEEATSGSRGLAGALDRRLGETLLPSRPQARPAGFGAGSRHAGLARHAYPPPLEARKSQLVAVMRAETVFWLLALDYYIPKGYQRECPCRFTS